MARMAHQRSIYRTGPHQSWVQRKTYHLMKIIRAIRACGRHLDAMPAEGGCFSCHRCGHLQSLPRGVYRPCPAALSALRECYRDAKPYADDTTGDVWQ